MSAKKGYERGRKARGVIFHAMKMCGGLDEDITSTETEMVVVYFEEC